MPHSYRESARGLLTKEVPCGADNAGRVSSAGDFALLHCEMVIVVAERHALAYWSFELRHAYWPRALEDDEVR